ncbi:MAG: VCBS repeat-containing protein [Byssovorax sp.]
MRSLTLLAASIALMLLAGSCSSGRAGTGSTSGHGGEAAATTTGAGGDGSSPTSASASMSASTGQGGAVDDSQSLTHIVQYPSLSKTWEGAVLVRTGGPVSTWKLDNLPLPPPTPKNPDLLLDTRQFADGEHTLWIEALISGAARDFTGKITFDNGGPAGPLLQGTFVDIAPSLGIPFPSMPTGQDQVGVIAADIDGDGDQDLFVWSPSLFTGRTYFQTGPMTFAQAAPPLGGQFYAVGLGDLDGDGLPELVAAGNTLRIFKNTSGSFSDVTAASGVAESVSLRDYRGVTLVDLDNDGLLDIVVARLDCTGGQSPNRYLRNEGDLRFVDIGPALGLDLPEANTFAVAVDRVGTDGALHVWPFQDSCQQGPMGKHYRFADGPDLPVLLDAIAPDENLGPMGSAVLDINGDGLVDEFIAGCFNSPVWTAPAFTGTIGPYVGLDAFPDPDGHFITAWAMATLDADLDGRPDIYVTHNPSDPNGNGPGSRDALFWQRAPGHFRDIGKAVGLTGYQPCRSVQVADLDGDGDSDLLIGCSQSVRVLRNDLVDPSAGRTLVLHGTLSNPDGVNAMITSPTGESRLTRGGGNPYAGGVTRETLRAPTGTFTITWPSGIVQKVDAGQGHVINVTEPDVVSVLPRRVDASAPAPVAIQIKPAALGDPAAAVTVTASAGVFSTPMHQDPDGVWRGTLAPPSAVATVVLEVTVGAQKLKVRPRVYVR